MDNTKQSPIDPLIQDLRRLSVETGRMKLKINFQENAPHQNTSGVVVGTDAEQMFLIYL